MRDKRKWSDSNHGWKLSRRTYILELVSQSNMHGSCKSNSKVGQNAVMSSAEGHLGRYQLFAYCWQQGAQVRTPGTPDLQQVSHDKSHRLTRMVNAWDFQAATRGMHTDQHRLDIF